ncbi:WD40 protein [Xylogone sp. PMI_703]|nr:WD40 protein [Xylogone sp. PMI_703]
MKNPSDYTVGIVCALSIERAAVEAMFDESHPLPDLSSDDTNSYTLGRIGKHNVVVTALPAGRYGTNAAATVVTQMKQCFTSIKFCLLVGIGGGAPSERNDVRLGDIVVSMPVETFGGVIQYDLGEKIQGQEELHLRGSLNSPPEVVLTALTALRAAHERQNSRIDDYIAHMFVSNDAMKSEYAYPGDSCDRLCPPELQHPSADAECGPQCIDSAIIRPPRQGLNRFIHYGLIASGNVVVKDAISRDRWARQHNILCFEMEAAGLMNTFPCLVIRGISDYADSHKNDRWQRYAAARAAAYAKEFLGFVMPAVVRPPQVVESSEGE